MAMGLKMDGLDSKVYVILGDGELAEGSNWEAAAAASHHKLDNLVAVCCPPGVGNHPDNYNFFALVFCMGD